MTEQEWEACADPQPMLELLGTVESDRKLRLYMCACCRGAWHRLKYAPLRRAIEITERFADHEVGEEDLRVLARTVGKIWYGLEDDDGGSNWSILAAIDPQAQATPALAERHVVNMAMHVRVVHANQRAVFLRDIFGNPFRPITFNPAWRSSDVMLLATGIYAERAFDRSPILADALQDAGCDSGEVLSHLRDGSVTHVRGCWALDLVLGKE